MTSVLGAEEPASNGREESSAPRIETCFLCRGATADRNIYSGHGSASEADKRSVGEEGVSYIC